MAFFFQQMYVEPHSTKQIEDGIGWGLETTAETLVDATAGRLGLDGAVNTPPEEACARVRCPVIVVHGTRDRIRPYQIGERLAELTGGSLVLLEGVGHGPMGRHPVQLNLMIREFVERIRPPVQRRTWVAPSRRRRRALYLSSPIGLGHAKRDMAIVEELRKLHPDLEVDWLAQHPVTAALEAAGERIHPASAWLANESAHIEHVAGEHDLHAFQAIRDMDEILVNNFMVFAEVVEQENYDLVVGDESWDVDYFLHENPALKRFAFAWMTDFVGWLPMPDGGDREAALTADYNAEMIEQRARYARVRDRSIFVGNPEDVVPESFGAGLPMIREWVSENFDFAGYVTGFDQTDLADRGALKARLGHRADERLCVVTVGGSGVGEPLLRRVLDAAPLVRRELSDLRFLVVAGPRIDPRSLPRRRGVSIRGHVPSLYQHLAAADLAVVQGGLTTTMELTANQRPFIYVPLRHHFEQNFHVPYRLERYGAGRRLDYEQAVEPDALAEAIVQEVGHEVSYRPRRGGWGRGGCPDARRAALTVLDAVTSTGPCNTDRVQPMLATKGDYVPRGGWTHEVKWDGMRVLVENRTPAGCGCTRATRTTSPSPSPSCTAWPLHSTGSTSCSTARSWRWATGCRRSARSPTGCTCVTSPGPGASPSPTRSR